MASTLPDRLLLLAALIVQSVLGMARVLRIGGIVSSEREMSAMRLAVQYVNQAGLLPPGVTLDHVTNQSGLISTFSNMQIACDQASIGVMAFVGPVTSTGTRAVAPIARSLAIPQISPSATNPLLGLLFKLFLEDREKYPNLLRMMPPDSMQSMALVALVEAFGWRRFTILTSNTDYGINGLLRFQSTAAQRMWRILNVQQFEATDNPDEINVSRQLMVIRNTGARVVLLNCLSVFRVRILAQAEQMGMLVRGWAWVVTDGISGTDSDRLSNMTGLLGTRPSAGSGKLWATLADEWHKANSTIYPGTDHPPDLYTSSVVDSVLAFGYSIRNMAENIDITNVTQKSLHCMTDTWEYGPLMLDYLRKVSGNGTMSDIGFGENGSPVSATYDIVNLKRGEWIPVGKWDVEHGIQHGSEWENIQLPGGERTIPGYVSHLRNKTLRVVIIDEEPFVRLNTSHDDQGHIHPNQVEGICIDLLQHLAQITGFEYTMYRVPDRQFGKKDPDTYQWDGLIGELVHRRADIAVGSLTISFPREQDVDFTKPYLDLGMRFVMQVPPVEPLRPFRFLDPFQTNVWMMTVLLTVVVGLYVSLLNKLSPYDYHGRFVYVDYPQSGNVTSYKEYRKLKSIEIMSTSTLNFSNSVWMSATALLQQGGEAYPKSSSARIALLTWLFAIIIIVATYTANLAAFLTASRGKTVIESIEDLGAQTKIKYGTVRSSAPRQFFEDSNVTLYKDMLVYMTQQNSFVNLTETGISKARKGGYAFIWDSAVLDFRVEQKPCNTLRNVGRLFGKIGYGFGLQKSSPYKDELSYHILKLREEGYMDGLVHKWYREKGECTQSNEDRTEQDEAIEAAGGKLGVEELLGVFIIVIGGMCISIFVLLVEWIVAVKANVHPSDISKPSSFCESLKGRCKSLTGDIREETSRFFGGRAKLQEYARNCSRPQESTLERTDICIDDVIMTITGSINRRQRRTLQASSQLNNLVTGSTTINGNSPFVHSENHTTFTYGNPAFQEDEKENNEIHSIRF